MKILKLFKRKNKETKKTKQQNKKTDGIDEDIIKRFAGRDSCS